jgi:hypothetical protein
VYVLLLIAVTSLAGCQPAGYLGYLMAPHMQEETKAEYSRLEGQTLAVVIDAKNSIIYDYPNVRRSLGVKISAEMAMSIDGLDVVNTSKIIYYQDNRPQWKREGLKKMGKALKADYVLCLSLIEYSGIAPGMSRAVQGRIMADASLHAVFSDVEDDCVWRAKEGLQSVFPERGIFKPGSEKAVLAETERQFAVILARKFYDHKVPISEE